MTNPSFVATCRCASRNHRDVRLGLEIAVVGLMAFPVVALAVPSPKKGSPRKPVAVESGVRARDSIFPVRPNEGTASRAEEPVRDFNRLLLAVEASAQGTYWYPGLETEGIKPIEYRTEGLASHKAQAIVGYDGLIFSFSYEAPFVPSARQKEMLVANKTRSAGIEKYTAGVDLRPVLRLLVPSVEDYYLLRVLLSARLQHSDAIYYGNARVPSTFMYLPLDAVIDWNSMRVRGAKRIEAGSGLAFRTKFTDSEITACLGGGKKYSFHGGYYELDWKRPSDNNYSYTIDGLPIIYETSYRSKGATFLLKNEDPVAPRWNGDFALRIGAMWIDDRIKDTNPREREAYHPTRSFFSFKGGFWYNWYWRREKTLTGPFLSLGAEFDGRTWSIDDKASHNNSTSTSGKGGGGDVERFLRVYMRAGYRF